MARHAAGELRVTIGRFSDYYGPHADNSLVWMLGIAPALRGRTVRTYLDADQPHTFAYLPDAAAAFATLTEQPAGDGRSWVLPAAPAITQRALYDLLDEALGRPSRRGHVTRSMLRAIGVFDRQLREAAEMRRQFTRPWTTDGTAFEATFGPARITPHADALAACVAAARDAAPAVAA